MHKREHCESRYHTDKNNKLNNKHLDPDIILKNKNKAKTKNEKFITNEQVSHMEADQDMSF